MTSLAHILIDYENVQPTADELKRVQGKHLRLWVVHGSHQKHFTMDRVAAWQPLGKQVSFVHSMKDGKNALDLHLAFCVGEAVEQARASGSPGCYVVLSKDKGFEALFGYLQGRGLLVGRADALPEALALAGQLRSKLTQEGSCAVAASQDADLSRVIEGLRSSKTNRPGKEAKLRNYIASHLAKAADSPEVKAVMSQLKSRNLIRLEGTKVTYHLSVKLQIHAVA